MKMVKSLLLGSAAGMVAVAGAQAADLPVKAKPVEYVKICSLYGDGFYYIPGTDTCLRVGGYVQADYYWNTTSAGANQPILYTAPGSFDRTTSQWNAKSRFTLQVDARNQTNYGTLRAYAQIHFNNAVGADAFNTSRAFVQFAGFTFGYTVSFADVPGNAWGDSGGQGILQPQLASDTAANGINQISYTWEIGNGHTLTVGADEQRIRSVTNLSNAGVWGIGADPTTFRAGQEAFDPYLAYKVNQAWGAFGITGFAQWNSAQYYTATAGLLNYGPTAACVAQPATTFCTHPADIWGGGVQAGVNLNMPTGNGNQDHIGGQVQYAIGAGKHGSGNNMTSPSVFGGGNVVTIGAQTDTVVINGAEQQQTTTWSVEGFAEHWFTPTFRFVAAAGVSGVDYNNVVKQGRWFCGGSAGGAVAPGVGALGAQNIVIGAATACDPGYRLWAASGHFDWYPVKNLRLGIEAGYYGFETAVKDAIVTLSKSIGARPTGMYTAKNLGTVALAGRARKDF